MAILAEAVKELLAGGQVSTELLHWLRDDLRRDEPSARPAAAGKPPATDLPSVYGAVLDALLDRDSHHRLGKEDLRDLGRRIQVFASLSPQIEGLLLAHHCLPGGNFRQSPQVNPLSEQLLMALGAEDEAQGRPARARPAARDLGRHRALPSPTPQPPARSALVEPRPSVPAPGRA